MAARRRETNRWDAVINGVNYRLKRQEGAYRKVSGRSQLEVQQMLNQAGNQFTSRRDLRTLFQTDWSGGAQWQKPLLSDQSIDSYNVSEGFDLVTEPGNIIPQPGFNVNTSDYAWYAIPSSGPRPVQVSSSEIYYVDDNGGAGNVRIAKWNGSSMSYLTNRFGTTSGVVAMCWDAANDTLYGLGGSDIEYVTVDSAGGTVIAHGETITEGFNIFMHYGRLLVWTGSVLLEIEDPLGTPAVTTIYTDGMGPDLLKEITTGTGAEPIGYSSTRTAVASAEGIWIAKNTATPDGPVATITRVDRTNDGTNVGVPVATLPPGTIVFDLIYHLGSLIMSTSSDTHKVFINDSDDVGFPRITFYHLTNDSLGTVGSPVGGLAPTESPYLFLGTDQARVYIGSGRGIWMYDPIRGGFHLWCDFGTTYGPFYSLVKTTDSSGNEIHLCTKWGVADTGYEIFLKDVGESTQTHTLESNYIDGNLPSELKSLVGITLMTDGIKTGETWTVTIEADDGSFASAATFNTVGAKTTYAALASAITGYRFRYKIAWTATGDITSPSRVKGIVLHMVQGEMVTAWQLTIDGSEMRSIENTVLRPEDALSDLETLMAKQTMTTFVDEMRVTSSTHDVRVDSVQVSRSSPSEIEEAVIVLTEQDLNN